jgi:hypothetical protein
LYRCFYRGSRLSANFAHFRQENWHFSKKMLRSNFDKTTYFELFFKSKHRSQESVIMLYKQLRSIRK